MQGLFDAISQQISLLRENVNAVPLSGSAMEMYHPSLPLKSPSEQQGILLGTVLAESLCFCLHVIFFFSLPVFFFFFPEE